MLSKLTFCFSLIAFVLSINSCGKKEEMPAGDQKDTAKVIQPQTDEPKTETKTSNELGIVEGIPEDYPADVPKPVNADSLGTIKSSDETSIRYFTSDMPGSVVDYYAKGLEKNGFKKADGESMKEEGGMVIWNKDRREVSVMLARDKDRGRTAVVVSYK